MPQFPLHDQRAGDVPDRVAVLRQSFRWANGVVLAPTFEALARRGAFDGLKPGQYVPLASRVGAQERALGTLWGSLKLLALQGWVRLDGSGPDSCYALTETGHAAAMLRTNRPAVFDRLPAWTQVLADVAALVDGSADEDAFACLDEMAQWHGRRWGLADDAGPAPAGAAVALTDALDGLLIGSLLVALDMPHLVRDGGRIVQRGGSVFAGWAGAVSDPARAQRLLPVALACLARHGLVDPARPALSAWGEAIRAVAAPFAGLGVSYLRSYARLDTIISDDPDPLGIASDRHVDRLVNIYASAGAGSGPLSATLLEQVIRPMFDAPLHAQPLGIADMGCGDGSALLRMARFIIDHTARGRALDEQPLIVIGADYNESARAVATARLAELAGLDGVIVQVVAADISDPRGYDDTVRALGLRPAGRDTPVGIADLAHSFMFLLHNRRLGIADDRAAFDMFAHHVGPAQAEALRAAFAISYAGPDGMVSGYRAAADLLHLLDQWRPYARHGLIALEGHSPAAGVEERGTLAPDELPHVLNWGMHFLSQQYMMPHQEFAAVLAIAGYRPAAGIFGRVYPADVDGPDIQPDTRFFSLAAYTPAGADA